MAGSAKGSPADGGPEDKYDIDDAPLTQEEEAEIAKMEGSQPPTSATPSSASASPSRKKRKRPDSASPHLTPTRLRYKPNSKHSFRQEQSLADPRSITEEVEDSGPLCELFLPLP